MVALLFLLQTFAGGGLAHYRVEPGAFYGMDIARFLPYTLLRTWHLQLAVFWIATAWVGGGLFLAPMVGGKEPKGQKFGVYALLGALALVVFGSMFGEYLGINNRLGNLWFWLGHQGSEYLDLGRFWQVLLAAGLIFWLFLMFRALKPALKIPEKSNGFPVSLRRGGHPALLRPRALLRGAHQLRHHRQLAVLDHPPLGRGLLRLFATVLVAVMFHQLGLVSARNATRIVYLDAILYLAGGIAGTAHHWYFTGQPAVSMAIGGCFSALEVVPSPCSRWTPGTSSAVQGECSDCGKPRGRAKWAIYFLMAVGSEFVGAGVFGFLINLPIVSYFQMGRRSPPTTGTRPCSASSGCWPLRSWCSACAPCRPIPFGRKLKICAGGVLGPQRGVGTHDPAGPLPAGALQLWDSVTNGYSHCRRLTYTMSGTFHTLEWVRMGADMVIPALRRAASGPGALDAFFKRDVAVNRD